LCLENAHFCLAYIDIGGVAPKALVFTRNKENMAGGKRIFISIYEGESIYPQCGCIRVSVGSTVVFARMTRRGFLLITAAQI